MTGPIPLRPDQQRLSICVKDVVGMEVGYNPLEPGFAAWFCTAEPVDMEVLVMLTYTETSPSTPRPGRIPGFLLNPPAPPCSTGTARVPRTATYRPPESVFWLISQRWQRPPEEL